MKSEESALRDSLDDTLESTLLIPERSKSPIKRSPYSSPSTTLSITSSFPAKSQKKDISSLLHMHSTEIVGYKVNLEKLASELAESKANEHMQSDKIAQLEKSLTEAYEVITNLRNQLGGMQRTMESLGNAFQTLDERVFQLPTLSQETLLKKSPYWAESPLSKSTKTHFDSSTESGTTKQTTVVGKNK
jgi:hypothetical protein